jgi:hypothetical protein
MTPSVAPSSPSPPTESPYLSEMEEEERNERIENIIEDMAESSDEETADLEEEIKCIFCLIPLSPTDLRCCGCDRILVHDSCVRRKSDCKDWRCSRCRDREIVTEMRFNEQRWDEKVFKNLMRVEPWADEGLLIKLKTGEAPGSKIERKNICAKARRYRLDEKKHFVCAE